MKNTRRTTIRDVADHAGVSTATVSKALRGLGYVSDATQAKIDKAVSELGYNIDKNARNLRSGQSHVIGVVLHNHIDTDGHRQPFLSDMILAITHRVVEYGYDALFLEQNTYDDWYSNEDWYDDIKSGRVDGFILLGGRTDHQRYLQRIKALNAKKVAFAEWRGTHSPGSSHCGVGIDGRDAARTAVTHLIKLGRKRIAFIGLEDNIPNSEMDQRRLGWLDAMKNVREVNAAYLAKLQGLIQLSTAEARSPFVSAQHITQGLLDREIEFDAIFAATDLMAMAAINTLRQNGRNVPDDISIVGFDNISAADYFSPPLTTVSQDTFTGGAVLVDKLIDLLSGRQADSIILPSRLIIRESCGAKPSY